MSRCFLWVALVAGCTFDAAGIGVPDSSVVADGATTDQSAVSELFEAALDLAPFDIPADQAASERALLDQTVLDVATDQTVPDQQVMDQAPPDMAKPLCATTYGGVSGFTLCQQTATECTFLFTNGTCDAKCQAYGGTCIKAAAEDNNSCNELYSTPCDTSHGDGLCTCTR